MLEELRIRGLGVIADATLELGPGLTVLTGETGAGKTMVLTGLALIAGGKTDAGLVRPGEERASVEARWRLPADSPARLRADEAGAAVDEDDALVVARTVASGGRSRAVAGGSGVPAQVLADISEHVLAVHGQHDQLRLLRPAEQRAALDRFAGPGLAARLTAYGLDFARWREVAAELDDLTARAQERAREAELLRAGLDRVAAVAPEVGEDERLRAEAERLTHAEQLGLAATEARTSLAGDDDAGEGSVDVLGLVARARRALGAVAEHDPALAALGSRLADVGVAAAEIASELTAYAAGVEVDPVRLADVQDRRAALGALTRLYGPDLADVLAWARDAAPRLLALDDDGDRRAALTAERDQLRARLEEAASAIGAERRRAAERFSAAVSEELTALAMPHARVIADVTDVGELRPLGRDAVELQLTPHPGSPARPLARGASGGELSRVMLAVEVVLATRPAADPTAGDAAMTLVFDEVDAGVGGRAAVEVGRRLARLARGRQVVVVTHLPQVAAFADRHLLVRRDDDGSVTASDVVPLADADRVIELSRMLAGLDSALAQGHAEELLALARSERHVDRG
ncbi:MAG TPA: DNA repair protein RecN [Mycobacteriales bacterium]|nr:DNA repair protein RecN [Mycobacteriales bacterium]